MRFKTIIACIAVSSFMVTGQAFANATEQTTSSESSLKLEMESLKEETKNPSVDMNVQLGLAAFEKTGDQSQNSSKQNVSAGLTFDIGDSNRVVETGLAYFQTSTEKQNKEINSGYVAIPLNAKFYTKDAQEGLYIKAGMLTSFLVTTSDSKQTRNLDLIGNIGLGSKIKMSSSYDFIIEGTYNRGFMDTLKSSGDTYNQGLMILGGISFGI
ncbi:MAG: outer membrane beta-barrel protein [Bdellovibrionales bacterium]|nr:outer membrane beta-barrel protein [Bdellovibrionales bacterium]